MGAVRYSTAVLLKVRRLPISILTLALVSFCLSTSARADTGFSREVAPILVKRCIACHGERVGQGGWRAHNYQFLMKAGASGQASVVAGSPERSRVFRLITEKNPQFRMPKGDDPLPPAEIASLKKWIAEGAKFDGPDPSVSIKSLLGARQHPAAPSAYRLPAPVLALAFVPGRPEIAVGGYNEVTFWNAVTGALVRRIGHLPQRIQAIAFHPDGKRMLVAGGTPGEYGEVSLVELTSGRRTVLDTFTDIVLCAAFSADGSRVAAGCSDASVRTYDLAANKPTWSARVHSDWVTSIGFSADGRFVASGSKDLTVKVYDAATGVLFTTYNGHNKQYGKYKGQFPVFAVRFEPDAPLAISAGAGPTIQIWDPVKAAQENGTAADMEERFAKESHARHIEHGFKQEVFALALRNGRLFAASGDGTVKQFDLATGKEVQVYKGLTDWVFALDVDPAGRRVAAGCYDGEIRVWNTVTGVCETRFVNNPGGRK